MSPSLVVDELETETATAAAAAVALLSANSDGRSLLLSAAGRRRTAGRQSFVIALVLVSTRATQTDTHGLCD